MSQKSKSKHPGWAGRPRLATQLSVLLVVIGFVPLLVTNGIGYLSSRNDVERLSTQALHNSAHAVALQTEVFIEEKGRIVPSLVAGNRHLQDTVAQALRDHNMGSPSKGTTALDIHLMAKARQSERLAEYYVLSPQGEMLGSSELTAARGEIRRDGCLELWKSRAPAKMESRQEMPTYLVAHPVSDQYGVTIGIFCGRFNFDLSERLPRWSSAELEATNFHLVDEHGQVLWSSAEAMDKTLVMEQLNGDLTWQGSHEDWKGEEMLVAVTSVDGAPWAVVAEIPSAKALASLLALRRRAVGLAGFFAALVLLTTVIAVRRNLRPLEDLVEATEKMRSGRLAQAVEVRGSAEIAGLAEVFNEMSREVSTLHETLEERVEERTRELHHKQQFIELVFDSMEENLIVVDEDFVVLKANQAARQTYQSPLVGSRCYQILMDRDSACGGCPVPTAIEAGEPFDTERVLYYRKEPEIISFRGFPLPGNGNKTPRKMLLVSRIITEEKQRERQMAHHEKMAAFALLAAGTAHEIGNPLASIKVQVEMARRYEDEELMAETLEVVGREVNRTERLLREMTGFARRRTNEESLICINRVVDDALRLLTHDPRSKSVTLEKRLGSDLPAVHVDDDKALQVLLNLGINGIDAAQENGTVIIETSADDEGVKVCVCNTGPPIPEEIRSRIFDPYFTTKPKGKGTGLGLFVSRRLTEEMGGELVLEPTPSQGKTAFVVMIPKAEKRQ